jgi:tetratricopeptide (TPR) repeat protein
LSVSGEHASKHALEAHMPMLDTVGRLRQLKAEALDLRARGDLPGSIGRLRTAIELGRAVLGATDGTAAAGDPAGLAAEQADCLGILGGNLLRRGDLREAIVVFREGRDLELGAAGQLDSSYNTVNLFVALVLEGGWDSLANVRADLDEAIGRVEARTARTAPADLWAWADLGMCEFLRGRLGAAQSAYARAAALASADQRRSVLARLLLLANTRVPPTPEARESVSQITRVLAD